PWRPFQHLEKRYFEVGDLGWPVTRYRGAVVGMCICNDRRWPETYRVMGLQGVELVLLGYNTPIHHPPAPEQDHLAGFHNHLSMHAGAYQNATWVVGVAKAGREEGCARHGLLATTRSVAPLGRTGWTRSITCHTCCAAQSRMSSVTRAPPGQTPMLTCTAIIPRSPSPRRHTPSVACSASRRRSRRLSRSRANVGSATTAATTASAGSDSTTRPSRAGARAAARARRGSRAPGRGTRPRPRRDRSRRRTRRPGARRARRRPVARRRP